MKAMMFFLFLTLALGFECFGQVNPKEVIYGTVRTDGYQKITKGAFWATRPEAKLIYEGGTPEGYTVVILDKDFFVRFVDGENNQFDKNYIVFPKGEIVYADNKTTQFYSAMCGNKIEYIRPVDLVIIKTNDVVQQQSKQEDLSFISPGKIYEDKVTIPPLFLGSEKKKTKTWFGKNWGWIAGTAIVLTGAGIYAYNHWGNHINPIIIKPPVIEPRTMPPGIPSIPTTPTIPTIPIPGIPSDPRTMPGGIGLNFNFSF